jgi:uncharacterized OB-fold protein
MATSGGSSWRTDDDTVPTMDVSDEELVTHFPDTRLDHDNRAFYAGWLNHRLLINRCCDCGHWHHPPRPLCPRRWSFNIVPAAAGGRGTVHLLIRLRQGPPAPGVDYSHPHPVATVELDEQEGLRLSSTIVDCPVEMLRIGMRVELTWIERYGVPYPVFQPMDRE